ncbi:MAG: hypothetical protein IT385_01565 [Deltaproteobacteria bacterium]|nr:hypothetical protein [Deltaproteobacteria bacterium]
MNDRKIPWLQVGSCLLLAACASAAPPGASEPTPTPTVPPPASPTLAVDTVPLSELEAPCQRAQRHLERYLGIPCDGEDVSCVCELRELVSDGAGAPIGGLLEMRTLDDELPERELSIVLKTDAGWRSMVVPVTADAELIGQVQLGTFRVFDEGGEEETGVSVELTTRREWTSERDNARFSERHRSMWLCGLRKSPLCHEALLDLKVEVGPLDASQPPPTGPFVFTEQYPERSFWVKAGAWDFGARLNRETGKISYPLEQPPGLPSDVRVPRGEWTWRFLDQASGPYMPH